MLKKKSIHSYFFKFRDVFYEADEELKRESMKKSTVKAISPEKQSINFLNELIKSGDSIFDRKETVYEECDDEHIVQMQNLYFRNMTNNSLDGNDLEKSKSKKMELMKNDINDLNIDIEYFKKNLKIVQAKFKGVKEKHFQNLMELQCFQGDSEQIWAARISHDGKFLATGGKSGVLKIWELYTFEESLDEYEYRGLISFLKFINESAYRIYTEHINDIIDLCWSPKVKL